MMRVIRKLVVVSLLFFAGVIPVSFVDRVNAERQYHIGYEWTKTWINQDGTIELLYNISIALDSGDDINYVLVGQPRRDFTIKNATDQYGHTLVATDASSESDYRVHVQLYDPLKAGETVWFTLITNVARMIYEDVENPDSVCMEFTPTWWAAASVSELRVLIVLPHNVTVDQVEASVNWNNTLYEDSRLAIYWERRDLSPGEKFPVGVSFPKEYMQSYETIYRVHNLDTRLNYTTIQEAINANETLNGHTISVDAGIYNENVVVNKSLTLTGENRSTTVIDGKGTGTVITVVSDSVTVSAFTIRNSGTSLGDSGIVLSGVSDCVIDDNNVTANGIGIYLVLSCNNTVRHNTITENWWGVYVALCNTTSIEGNVLENKYRGMLLADSSGNTLKNNNMTGPDRNLGIYGHNLSHFLNDIDTTNTVHGKAVYYLINKNDLILNSSLFPNAGFIALINSTRIRVEGLNLTRNYQGILFAYTDNSTIKDVNTTNNWIGIYLFASNHNKLIENTATENSCWGIDLSDNACNNTIIGNWLAKNHAGIHVYSNNNRLIRNRISENEYRGVYVTGSQNLFRGNEISDNGIGITTGFTNIIYHNNFVNNTEHANLNLPRATAIWDNGAEGNYWSNHNTTDLNHDGIGDTSYEIAVNNTDHYPLMGMFHSFNTSSSHDVNVISNSTIENFGCSETNSTIKIVVSNTTTAQTYGFCRVCIPKDLMPPPYSVTIDDGLTEVLHFNDTIYDNNTHRWIYFAYQHSTHEITIIPEFSSHPVLLLFVMTTLLAATVYRRRR